jgi:hypothetical protein
LHFTSSSLTISAVVKAIYMLASKILTFNSDNSKHTVLCPGITLETEESRRNFSLLWEYQINVVSSCNKKCETRSIKQQHPHVRQLAHAYDCIYNPSNILVIRFYRYKAQKCERQCLLVKVINIYIERNIYIENNRISTLLIREQHK